MVSADVDLSKGTTLAHFQMVGKVEDWIERLITWVRAGARMSAISLIDLVSI